MAIHARCVIPNGSAGERSLVAAFATAGRILPAMLPSHGYQGFRTAPIPSGWVQMGESWVLWWNGRQIAQVTPAKDCGVRVHLDARKMWQTKDERAASIAQGKRYAERWCAARAAATARAREALEPRNLSVKTKPGAPRIGRRSGYETQVCCASLMRETASGSMREGV